MALRVSATSSVLALLRELRDDPNRSVIFAALSARVTAIRNNPGDVMVRGAPYRLRAGQLARVVTLFVPEVREEWVMVWTLDASGPGPAVRIELVEQV